MLLGGWKYDEFWSNFGHLRAFSGQRIKAYFFYLHMGAAELRIAFA
jgi:hypothetical protein